MNNTKMSIKSQVQCSKIIMFPLYIISFSNTETRGEKNKNIYKTTRFRIEVEQYYILFLLGHTPNQNLNIRFLNCKGNPSKCAGTKIPPSCSCKGTHTSKTLSFPRNHLPSQLKTTSNKISNI